MTKPLLLPPTHEFNAEGWRKIAATVNALVARLPLASPPADLPADAVPVLTYYDPAKAGLLFWSGTEWRWAATSEAAP